MSLSSLVQTLAIVTVTPTLMVGALLLWLSAGVYWTAAVRQALYEVVREAVFGRPDFELLHLRAWDKYARIARGADQEVRPDVDLALRDQALASMRGGPDDALQLESIRQRRSELLLAARVSMGRRCTRALSIGHLLRLFPVWYGMEGCKVWLAGFRDESVPLGRRLLRRLVDTAGVGGAVGVVVAVLAWVLSAGQGEFIKYVGDGGAVGAFAGLVWTAAECYRRLLPAVLADAAHSGGRLQWHAWIPFGILVATGPILHFRLFERLAALMQAAFGRLLSPLNDAKTAPVAFLLVVILYLAWRTLSFFRAACRRGQMPLVLRLELLETAFAGLTFTTMFVWSATLVLPRREHGTAAASSFLWIVLIPLLLTAVLALSVAAVRAHARYRNRQAVNDMERELGRPRQRGLPLVVVGALWVAASFVSVFVSALVIVMNFPSLLSAGSETAAVPVATYVLAALLTAPLCAGVVHVIMLRRRRIREAAKTRADYEHLMRRTLLVPAAQDAADALAGRGEQHDGSARSASAADDGRPQAT